MSHYIFYKIVCEDCPDYIYIGSTKSYRSRKNQHKTACNNINSKIHNLNLYQKIREYGGWDNWNMIRIDEANELTFTQARIKEEELRLKYNGNLNSRKAYITEEEAKERKEYQKEYYQNNKEKKREYHQNNKEDILEKKREYYLNNKEKIQEYKKEYHKQRYLKKKEEALNKE